MTTEIIEQDIRKFLGNSFLHGNEQQLRSDDALLGNVIDSTGVIELVMFLQEHFGISVDDADISSENLGSLNTTIQFVQSKLHKAS